MVSVARAFVPYPPTPEGLWHTGPGSVRPARVEKQKAPETKPQSLSTVARGLPRALTGPVCVWLVAVVVLRSEEGECARAQFDPPVITGTVFDRTSPGIFIVAVANRCVYASDTRDGKILGDAAIEAIIVTGKRIITARRWRIVGPRPLSE